jgi:hypothetical protein
MSDLRNIALTENDHLPRNARGNDHPHMNRPE